MQTFYTVRQGESLYSIAKRWELPVAALIAANNLTPPYLLYPGQQLSVPPGIRRLQVRAGDTVYELSKEYGVPSQLIIETNRLAPPYELQIDQWLTLPIGLPYYVVQPGDSLYTIGLRFNVASGRYIRTDLIQEANRLPSEQVTPGMRLIIPYAPTGESGIIAYTTNRGGSFDIWLYDPASGQSVPLSSGLGESFTVPFWSPDGSRIAFVGSWNRLYVVEVSTAGVMEVAGKVDPGAYISWSPDGKRLAFPLPDGIALFTLATTRTSILPLPSAEYAQWFPTGDRLLYSQTDEAGNGQLYEVRVDGTSSRQLTNYTGGLIHNVRLSPDGLSALFTSPGASISLVHTVRLADGVIKVLQGGPLGKNYDPVWLAVGSLVAYSSTVFSERKGYFSSIQTEAASGGDRRIWAVSDCFASPVDGSPGGDVLAYLSGCRGDEGQATELWTVSGRHPVPILAVAGGFLITSVKWSRSEASRLPRRLYRSEAFQVAFPYPAHWREVSETRYEGFDGFFEISAIASEASLSEVCRSEAYHQLRPYGSSPRVISTLVQERKACLIYPSADQPPEMNRQSALIVAYPRPITYNGSTYQYFILWADRGHIHRMVEGLRFL